MVWLNQFLHLSTFIFDHKGLQVGGRAFLQRRAKALQIRYILLYQWNVHLHI